MEKTVTIGLLAPAFMPLTGYEETARDLGLRLAVVTPQKIRWTTRQVDALIWQDNRWHNKVTSLPTSMYNRFYSPKQPFIDAIEKIIGRDKIFNHITRFDKWEMHTILENSLLRRYMPPTALYSSQSLQDYLKRYDSVILKPRLGHLGYQILLIQQDSSGYYLHHGSKYPVASYSNLQDLNKQLSQHLSTDYLIQQFIPFSTLDGRVFDVRALVQKGATGTWEVTGLISRIALKYSYVTNISVQVIPGEEALLKAFPNLDLLAPLVKASIKGAQIVEQSLGSLGEISVDFAFDEQGTMWIIELNGKPMKSIFKELNDPITLKKVYNTPLAYARYLATK